MEVGEERCTLNSLVDDNAAVAAIEEGAMPIYITQGRYTREAIKGMIVKPEDRYEALSRHVARAGGRVLNYYMTFGEYDFLTVIEARAKRKWQPSCSRRRPPAASAICAPVWR
jgi:uncharacterized protein with GYD domain